MPKAIFNKGSEVFVSPPCWQGVKGVESCADKLAVFKVGEIIARTETVRGSWRAALKRCN
jgi:hypothetical protein